jgi:t-SNARE complex subunit (syntaxin)
VGITEGSDNNIQVNIIPNPNNGTFKINILGINDDIDMYLINSNGVMVKHKKLINTNTPMFSKEFDLENIPKGLYYLKFVNNKIVHIEKMIVN